MTIIAKVGASYVDHINDDTPEVDSFFFTDVTKHSPPLVLRREPENIEYLNPLIVSRNNGLGYSVGLASFPGSPG